MASILPDEAAFSDFRNQCVSTDNWVKKYDKNNMQVWVEVPAKKKKGAPKIHKVKVSSTPNKHTIDLIAKVLYVQYVH